MKSTFRRIPLKVQACSSLRRRYSTIHTSFVVKGKRSVFFFFLKQSQGLKALAAQSSDFQEVIVPQVVFLLFHEY